MTHPNTGLAVAAAVVRFATWVMPRHRRDWAEAMLNEVAYIESRRAAVSWALGCVVFALKERSSYELTRGVPTRASFRALLGVSAALIMAGAGVYAVQKPYQRERILLTVLHGCRRSGCPPHSSRAVTDAWAINLGEANAHEPRASR